MPRNVKIDKADFSPTLRAALEAEKKRLEDERDEAIEYANMHIRQIDQMLAGIGYGGGGAKRSGGKTPDGKKSGKRRVRRSAEQLAAEASKVLAMIRNAGKEGIGGGEIRKKHPGVGQNIKGFVKQYTGEPVKTTGQKAAMKYHA